MGLFTGKGENIGKPIYKLLSKSKEEYAKELDVLAHKYDGYEFFAVMDGILRDVDSIKRDELLDRLFILRHIAHRDVGDIVTANREKDELKKDLADSDRLSFWLAGWLVIITFGFMIWGWM